MWPHKHAVEFHTQPNSDTGGERGGCDVGRTTPPEGGPVRRLKYRVYQKIDYGI
jgi:hypothetical protein